MWHWDRRYKMKKQQITHCLLLLLTAFIWGNAFVAQSASMDYIGPFTMNATRNVLGVLVLLPVIAVMNRKKAANGEAEVENGNGNNTKTLVIGGVCCGVFLCVASNFQQFGISYTTVGKAGFITALYIVIVPILGIFRGKKAGIQIWLGVALAVVGLYLLCMQGGLHLDKGDSLVLGCALVFSMHILTVDYFAPRVDGVKLSCIQFMVSGILSGICMMIFEKPQLSQILSAWLPICYAGLLSSGAGYTLQIVGQKGLNPTVASLIMSLESVFAALAGFVLLGQNMSVRELVGCVLMFAAIILAQLPGRRKE